MIESHGIRYHEPLEGITLFVMTPSDGRKRTALAKKTNFRGGTGILCVLRWQRKPLKKEKLD